MITPADFKQLITKVQRPGRYLGGEIGQVKKDPQLAKLKVALVFPDVYDMGESHLGLKILYKILNSQPHILAERVYAPWSDMEVALRQSGLPLFSLENRIPLNEFDLIGITLPYELVYTNVLQILDLGRVSLWQKDRGADDPIVIAGGNNAFNPEPVADFFDAIVVGDGEPAVLPIAKQIMAYKQGSKNREELLADLKNIEGVYVPSFFDFEYSLAGSISKRIPKYPHYTGVKKATIPDLNQADYPEAPIVPHVQVIHDRVGVEIQRGCVRGCRFCQAGYIYRPERQRSPHKVKELVKQSLESTGYQELSLLSLSAGDYGCVSPLLEELFSDYPNVSIGLPATRTETLKPEIIAQIKRGRTNSFTIAPEAGTARMRRIINKGNASEDLFETATNVFKQGFGNLKLYYMCGLPFETQEDLQGIVDESYTCLKIGRAYRKNLQISMSVSAFVPKPFTPFQWEPQCSLETIKEKHRFFRDQIQGRNLKFKWHNPEMTYLEGVFSRGDRRLSKVILEAYLKGCRFDQWEECFDFFKWQQAFSSCAVDANFYVTRRRSFDEILPWDHLFVQMKQAWLKKEWESACQELYLEDCSTDKCTNCGTCDFQTTKNINFAHEKSTQKFFPFSTRGRKLKGIPSGDLGNATERIEEKEATCREILRVKFKKVGPMAYLGHLELREALLKAVRRSKLPISYSQGFHPRPLLSLGVAQPVGIESLAEFFDIRLTKTMKTLEFQSRLSQVLPSGLEVLQVTRITGNEDSLSAAICGQVYYIESPGQGFPEVLKKRIKENDFSTFDLFVTREKREKKKIVDLRPFIKEISLESESRLKLVTQISPQGGAKPQEIINALAGETLLAGSCRILKIQSIFRGLE